MSAAGIASQLLQFAIALALAPLLVGWVNQCRAWLQNKSAPSLFLPYFTIRKLFVKDAVVAEGASAIFRTTPYIVFGAMILANKFAATFKDFPPIQKPNSFTIDDAIKAMADVEGAHR